MDNKELLTQAKLLVALAESLQQSVEENDTKEESMYVDELFHQSQSLFNTYFERN